MVVSLISLAVIRLEYLISLAAISCDYLIMAVGQLQAKTNLISDKLVLGLR